MIYLAECVGSDRLGWDHVSRYAIPGAGYTDLRLSAAACSLGLFSRRVPARSGNLSATASARCGVNDTEQFLLLFFFPCHRIGRRLAKTVSAIPRPV